MHLAQEANTKQPYITEPYSCSLKIFFISSCLSKNPATLLRMNLSLKAFKVDQTINIKMTNYVMSFFFAYYLEQLHNNTLVYQVDYSLSRFLWIWTFLIVYLCFMVGQNMRRNHEFCFQLLCTQHGLKCRCFYLIRSPLTDFLVNQ